MYDIICLITGLDVRGKHPAGQNRFYPENVFMPQLRWIRCPKISKTFVLMCWSYLLYRRKFLVYDYRNLSLEL